MTLSEPVDTRFKTGDGVRVDARAAVGHCRAPWYLRGQSGVVAEVLGVFRDPERLAYHRPGLPAQVLYKVRFKQTTLWHGYRGAAGDHLEADISENWLVPDAQAKPALASRKARSS